MRRPTVVAACALAVLAVASSAASGASADASDIAIDYVKDNAQALGLTGGDVNDMRVSNEVLSSHSGTTHVYLQQTHKGIAVQHGLLTVNVAEGGWVISTGNRFVPQLASKAAGQQRRGAVQAAEAAARSVGLNPADLRILSEGSGPSKKSTVSAGGIAAQPITAELFWNRAASGAVRLAWNLQIHEVSSEHVWSINVDAESGSVLSTDDFVDEDDTDAIRSAISRSSGAAGIAAQSITPEDTVEDGSSYRVFPLPFESPSDGDRALVQEPASADASPFGWHDTNGAAGRRVHADTRQQRARVHGPRQQQRPRSPNRSGRRTRVSTSTSRSISTTGRSTTATRPSRTSSTGTTSSTTSSTGTGSTRPRGTSRSRTTATAGPGTTTSGRKRRTEAGATTRTS